MSVNHFGTMLIVLGLATLVYYVHCLAALQHLNRAHGCAPWSGTAKARWDVVVSLVTFAVGVGMVWWA